MPRIHLGVYETSGNSTKKAVTYALEAGYRAIDSAEWYENEAEVGSAIKTFLSSNPKKGDLKREDIWFTTKLRTNNSYDATRKEVKESLRKSGLGYLDLYLLHSPLGGKRRRLECWRAVEDAIEDGEVRCGGVSNFGVGHVCFRFFSSPWPHIQISPFLPYPRFGIHRHFWWLLCSVGLWMLTMWDIC